LRLHFLLLLRLPLRQLSLILSSPLIYLPPPPLRYLSLPSLYLNSCPSYPHTTLGVSVIGLRLVLFFSWPCKTLKFLCSSHLLQLPSYNFRSSFCSPIFASPLDVESTRYVHAARNRAMSMLHTLFANIFLFFRYLPKTLNGGDPFLESYFILIPLLCHSRICTVIPSFPLSSRTVT
jgi:hypothetical protein